MKENIFTTQFAGTSMAILQHTSGPGAHRLINIVLKNFLEGGGGVVGGRERKLMKLWYFILTVSLIVNKLI